MTDRARAILSLSDDELLIWHQRFGVADLYPFQRGRLAGLLEAAKRESSADPAAAGRERYGALARHNEERRMTAAERWAQAARELAEVA